MGLIGPLGLGRRDVVAVVGAGGKTSLVYALAAEARSRGWRVLVTTTTHMGTLPQSVTGPTFVQADGEPLEGLAAALDSHGVATVLGRRLRPDKLQGIPPEQVDRLAPLADLTLVEADGARGRSLKAPAEHEPVLPATTSLLVALLGLDALGAALGPERVHRVEQVAALTGRAPGDTLGEADLAACLAAAGSYPSRLARPARTVAFLNKAEDTTSLAAAERIARLLIPPYDAVVAGSARAGRARAVSPAAAVVLAAGESRRMGRPKLCLPLAGGTLLGAAVAPLLEAGLDPVVVVLGSRADELRRTGGLPAAAALRIVSHAGWGEGMASSLRRGLEECSGAGAVVVALADQAGVSAARVARLVEAWRAGAPLAVPVHAGRASHPVVFDRSLWPELRRLTGDVGAREVVRAHQAEAALLECEPLRDVDTPADYEGLRLGLPPRDDDGLPLLS